MDIEDIIIEALRFAEQTELQSENQLHIYTCMVKSPGLGGGGGGGPRHGMFSEVALTGDICVCAHEGQVALLLFFLLYGIFDYGDDKLEWYTQTLSDCINRTEVSCVDADEVTAEIAMKLWNEWYGNLVEISQHNITQPIIVYPIISHGIAGSAPKRGTITFTPSISDIWTLPRVRRQFTDD